MFQKGDFDILQVVGQFNLGFIIATLPRTNDMFILDQHACDEKFNFENLSQTTVLSAQDLVMPIKMHLGVNEELAINLHREIFKMNGFKIE